MVRAGARSGGSLLLREAGHDAGSNGTSFSRLPAFGLAAPIAL